MADEFKAGDRIEMVHQPDDPCPVPPGTRGTVDHVSGPHRLGREPFVQLGVKWDNGRTLSVIIPPDVVRKLPANPQ